MHFSIESMCHRNIVDFSAIEIVAVCLPYHLLSVASCNLLLSFSFAYIFLIYLLLFCLFY